MSGQGRDENWRDDAGPEPRVFVADAPDPPGAGPLQPRVIMTGETGRIVPAPTQAPAKAVAERRRPRLAKRLAIAGLLAAFGTWLGVDLVLWLRSAFDYDEGLGWAATAAVSVGIVAATALVVHELRSFFALRKVAAVHERMEAGADALRPADMQDAIRGVIAALPKDHETETAIEAFQRRVQRHHSAPQQVELLSGTVMSVLDRRAEAAVRRAGLRAFGVTAVSPTALTDALFFLAISIRMVREVAAGYGHRPTALATAWLLRRLVAEAGKLGAVDLAGMALSQHLGGAIAERVATSAAESIYAAQRMARLGLVAMSLCRPVPFLPGEVPGILNSLVGKLIAQAVTGNKRDRRP